MAVRPVPEGFHTVTPYLTVADAAGLLGFIKKAFDATEHYVMRGPGGEIRHGDVIVGNSHIMLGETGGQWPFTPAQLATRMNGGATIMSDSVSAPTTDPHIAPTN